jgi:hypothetical protein
MIIAMRSVESHKTNDMQYHWIVDHKGNIRLCAGSSAEELCNKHHDDERQPEEEPDLDEYTTKEHRSVSTDYFDGLMEDLYYRLRLNGQ